MAYEFDYLVYAGRFQPFHNRHLDVLHKALSKSQTVIVVLGSARRARNIRNPFSDGEREQMIRAAVAAADPKEAEQLVFCPVRDYCDVERWVAAVKDAVGNVAGHGARVGIIGHLKDESLYLREFPDWPLVQAGSHVGVRAAELHRYLFSAGGDSNWNELAAAVPRSVLAFLEAFRRSPVFAGLAEEFAVIEKDRTAWASAPYAPVFVTVDAVVRCNDNILLVRRGGHPGRGQWALPGGFVEQNEKLRDAAVRELAEETGLATPAEALRSAIVDTAVFDDPERSVRGRTITHGFFFDLKEPEPPAVAGGDDAAETRWFRIGPICDMETEIFEDHILIMDRFLNIFGMQEQAALADQEPLLVGFV